MVELKERELFEDRLAKKGTGFISEALKKAVEDKKKRAWDEDTKLKELEKKLKTIIKDQPKKQTEKEKEATTVQTNV